LEECGLGRQQGHHFPVGIGFLGQVSQTAFRQIEGHICLTRLASSETQSPLLGCQLYAVEWVTGSEGLCLRQKKQTA